jgi:lipopolysaccharide biosynthesis glycosyltransferase
VKKSDHSLVFVLDSSYYLDLFKIALYSINKNNDISNLDINLFVLKDQEVFFTPILEKFKFKNYFIHHICIEKYDGIGFSKQRDWSFSPAFRFEIFKLKKYKSILYLDTDILCLSNFLDIFQVDNFSVCKLHKATNEYYFENKFFGFNAGVMLIPREFLKAKTSTSLIKLCKKTKFNGNQEPLNFYFKDHINFLPQSYNTTTDLLTLDNLELAKIVHFIGLEKYNFLENKLYFSSYVANFLSDFLKIKLNNIYNKYFLEAKQFYGE